MLFNELYRGTAGLGGSRVGRLAKEASLEATWDEAKHPRNKDGEFASKAGGDDGASTDSAPRLELNIQHRSIG
jgi:hypothetical protein